MKQCVSYISPDMCFVPIDLQANFFARLRVDCNIESRLRSAASQRVLFAAPLRSRPVVSTCVSLAGALPLRPFASICVSAEAGGLFSLLCMFTSIRVAADFPLFPVLTFCSTCDVLELSETQRYRFGFFHVLPGRPLFGVLFLLLIFMTIPFRCAPRHQRG